ncbi:AAA family ATPase [Priestia megaterium]
MLAAEEELSEFKIYNYRKGIHWMELLYLWVEDYKHLKNISVNLGSELLFNFTDYNYKLDIRINEMYIENFFCIPNSENEVIIKNVTAIVGENGTGKSTILDFLVELFCYEEKLDSNYFIIYRLDATLYYQTNLNTSQKKLDINNFTEVDYKLKKQNLQSIKDKKVLFFSNIFDARAAKINELDNYQSLLNLSTNYLSSNSNTESNLRFLNEEFTRQIYFVKKFTNTLKLKRFINIPDFIKIELKMFDLEMFDHKFRNAIDVLESMGIPVLLSDLDKNHFKYNFHKALIISTLIDIGEFISGTDDKLYNSFINAIEDFAYHILKFKEYHTIGTHYLQDFKDHIEDEVGKNSQSKIFKKYIGQIDERIRLRIKLLDELDLLDYESMSSHILKVKTESEKLSSFLDHYNNISVRYAFLDFTWTELSSGEYALLSLFGRFYSVREQLGKQNIILIDEGDLYFHPQWQKDWLYHLLQVINVIYSDIEIQLILTTHSPFVLSDIPNYNVIFLEKVQGMSSKVSSGLEGGQRTFAANIHSLFTNSFFINGGLCGLFAKEKINDLVNELLDSSPEKIRSNEKRIRNTIDIIGEPLVKKKLLDIFEDKVKLNMVSIDRRIADLQKQIDYLKEIRQ